MKKLVLQKMLFPIAALTLAAGTAAVLGNGLVMAWSFAENVPTERPASVSCAAEEENIPPTVIRRETGRPDEDGTVTVATMLDNGTTVFVRYASGEKEPKVALSYHYGDGRSEAYSYEGDAAAAVIERFGGPGRAETPGYAKGQPSENDIPRDDAVSAALDALTGKYALRQEALDRFTVTAEFYTVYEDLTAPVWRVYLYPANADDFSKIGCYTALIDAKTGETARMLSAADGRG